MVLRVLCVGFARALIFTYEIPHSRYTPGQELDDAVQYRKRIIYGVGGRPGEGETAVHRMIRISDGNLNGDRPGATSRGMRVLNDYFCRFSLVHYYYECSNIHRTYYVLSIRCKKENSRYVPLLITQIRSDYTYCNERGVFLGRPLKSRNVNIYLRLQIEQKSFGKCPYDKLRVYECIR